MFLRLPRRIRGGNRRNMELLFLCLAAVPVVLLYALYIVNDNVALSLGTLAVPVGLFVAFAAAHVAVRILAPDADPVILPVVFLLSGIGIAFVTRLAPDLAENQVLWLFISVAAMIATLFFVRNLDKLADYKYTLGLVGVILLILPMVIGTEKNGSKLWLTFGSFSFQPGELAKILIVLFLAFYLASNREALSVTAHRVGPFRIPRFRMLLPLFIMWGISLLIVIFERDLGSALLFFMYFVVMLYVATGRWSYVFIAIGLLVIGFFFCYHFFSHVKIRVDIWLDPWTDAQNSGYQIVQSLYSIADGEPGGHRHWQGHAHPHPLCRERLPLLGHRQKWAFRRQRRHHPLHALLRARLCHRGTRQVRLFRLCRGGSYHGHRLPGVPHHRRRHQLLPLVGVTLPS